MQNYIAFHIKRKVLQLIKPELLMIIIDILLECVIKKSRERIQIYKIKIKKRIWGKIKADSINYSCVNLLKSICQI